MSNAEHLATVMVEQFIKAVEQGIDLVPVLADSTSTAKISPFIQRFPDRIVNVGIAEQTMVGTAVGLSIGGKIAVTCNAAPFLISRANEQLKVDVCYNNSNVKLFGLNAGCSYGPLASTHHSIDDIAVLRGFGNIEIYAALYGQGITQSGEIKATYGTGSSLMTTINTPHQQAAGLSTTIAWHDGELRYALEGNITHTGSGFAWIGQMLGIPSVTQLTELALSAESNQGVFFVPALSGLGAPYWDVQARGLLCGLCDATTPAIIARAGLEAIAYQIADVFFAMEQASQAALPALRVDGGATQNRWLMQFQADLLQRPLIRNHNAEVSALGAAYLGGKMLGWWEHNEQIAALPREVEVIEPSTTNHGVLESYQQWRTAVARARLRPES
ncbi:FGGY-family carbohydrate kinase [Pectobacterium brasiliense]|uniref:FGGY-family carbohydrate kinase n=1 Tax=Pectobacterium brasiliense TaxID=180957 RepID=UPI002A82D257|nr:FGGY-family carbohydrate kinase [Pectobacterium brasiliense]MDY4333184.1 FGGY-family carbohydrate kinase [Pectobacterium brasiliense]